MEGEGGKIIFGPDGPPGDGVRLEAEEGHLEPADDCFGARRAPGSSSTRSGALDPTAISRTIRALPATMHCSPFGQRESSETPTNFAVIFSAGIEAVWPTFRVNG